MSGYILSEASQQQQQHAISNSTATATGATLRSAHGTVTDTSGTSAVMQADQPSRNQ